jgi:hypothetical protein
VIFKTLRNGGLDMYKVVIKKIDGTVEEVPCGNEPRCDNCGKPSSEAETCIGGGYLTEEEWACCEPCYDEMVEKGCCFVEFGAGVYRQQKY